MVCRFVWDEAKYPTMSPLREIVDSIHGQVAKIEDDLKVCFYRHCNSFSSYPRLSDFYLFYLFFSLDYDYS